MSIIQLDEKDGFGGEVIVVADKEGRHTGRGVLQSAHLVDSAGRAELGIRDGRAFLSFPISGGSVTFEAAEAKLQRGGHSHIYPYRDREAVTRLNNDLAGDAIYAEFSSRFMRLATERLAALERTGQVAETQLSSLRGDPHKPGSAAWGGIEVFSFIDCMTDCMEEHWLTTCLLLCGAKAATGGGRIFPEK
jgi:hypothetical protein